MIALSIFSQLVPVFLLLGHRLIHCCFFPQFFYVLCMKTNLQLPADADDPLKTTDQTRRLGLIVCVLYYHPRVYAYLLLLVFVRFC